MPVTVDTAQVQRAILSNDDGAREVYVVPVDLTPGLADTLLATFDPADPTTLSDADARSIALAVVSALKAYRDAE